MEMWTVVVDEWTVVVDGYVYGFFESEAAAMQWAAKEFPVAVRQENYRVYEFVSVSVRAN